MCEGVEWALHACITLDWIGDRPVPAARLASTYALPAPYLNQHLQALARAGIGRSTPGPRGGLRSRRLSWPRKASSRMSSTTTT